MPVIHIPRRTYRQPQGRVTIDRGHPALQGDFILYVNSVTFTEKNEIRVAENRAYPSTFGVETGAFGRVTVCPFFAGLPRTVLYAGGSTMRTYNGYSALYGGVQEASLTGLSLGQASAPSAGARRTITLTSSDPNAATCYQITTFTGNSNWVAWNGGAKRSFTTSGTATTYSSATSFVLGYNVGNGADAETVAAVYLASDVAIPAEAAASLSANPWQLFRSEPRRIYSFPSSPISILRRFDGGAWQPATLRRWNGVAWEPANLRRWNGSEWVAV